MSVQSVLSRLAFPPPFLRWDFCRFCRTCLYNGVLYGYPAVHVHCNRGRAIGPV